MARDLLVLIIAMLVTLCSMPLAIRLRPGSHDKLPGVQDVHLAPTSRFGGAVVFVGYASGLVAAIVLNLAPAKPLIALIGKVR